MRKWPEDQHYTIPCGLRLFAYNSLKPLNPYQIWWTIIVCLLTRGTSPRRTWRHSRYRCCGCGSWWCRWRPTTTAGRGSRNSAAGRGGFHLGESNMSTFGKRSASIGRHGCATTATSGADAAARQGSILKRKLLLNTTTLEGILPNWEKVKLRKLDFNNLGITDTSMPHWYYNWNNFWL